jgi:hypothetical protein
VLFFTASLSMLYLKISAEKSTFSIPVPDLALQDFPELAEILIFLLKKFHEKRLLQYQRRAEQRRLF